MSVAPHLAEATRGNITERAPRINFWWHLRRRRVSGWVVLAVLILAVSAYLSVRACSWGWMMRSGGAVALVGGLLGFPRLLRLGPHKATRADAPLVVGNQFSIEGLHQSVDALTDSYAQTLGVGLVVLGTVLACYGDLAFELVWPLTTACRP